MIFTVLKPVFQCPDFNHNTRYPQRNCASIFFVLALLICTFLMASLSEAQTLRVLRQGLGDGNITGTGISCGADCNETFGVATNVTLTASAAAGSQIATWEGDCAGIGTGEGGTSGTCVVNVADVSSVRVKFDHNSDLAELTDLTPEGIASYLALGSNAQMDTPAEFISVLSDDFLENWLLMVRSESLQTGTATSPRILLPSADSRAVFTFGMTEHSSYPGSHPNAVEYMQWDEDQKNFRFHEIVLDTIPAMGDVVKRSPGQPDVRRFKARARGVSADDEKCFACHSTNNVLNDKPGATPGTDGFVPGSIPHKSKPNWDTYDSWGGLLAFNRDRLYQGSVEVAAFRKLFNPWTWQDDVTARGMIELLKLQPAGVPAAHVITRNEGGGANDGHISFVFDGGDIVTKEDLPASSSTGSTNYEFDGAPRVGGATNYVTDGQRVTLHHSTLASCFGGGCSAASDEGRGVDLFDELFGVLNPIRVADEVANHRFATGSVPFDARPLALAVAQGCFSVGGGNNVADTQTLLSNPALSSAATAALDFFNTRHNISSFDELFDDTRLRQAYMPLRKADLQKIALDRTIDPYAFDANLAAAPPPPALVDGLVQSYGAATELFNPTSGPLDAAALTEALRTEVFRREPGGQGDSTFLGGIYVDREVLGTAPKMALYRYFLEPLGISVDKWSIAVRGRSRTYTMADIFMGRYNNSIAGQIKAELGIDGLGMSDTCDIVMPMVEASMMPDVLPDADGPSAMPKFTDIQRIFNKSCIECHGGLGYPPYHSYRPNPIDPNEFDLHETELNFSENETPVAPNRRMTRSFNHASSNPSYLLNRMTDGGRLAHPYDPDEPYNLANPNDPADPDVLDESCPYGLMPCGGPPLSWADIKTFERWADGGATYSEGDPHIKTVDGTRYDLQTAGEFVLLRGEGFELQSRHTPVTTAGPLGPNAHTGLSTCVSVNTAVAFRSGDQRVTYQPGMMSNSGDDVQRPKDNSLVLRIDGKPINLGNEPISLVSGDRIRQTNDGGGFQIEQPGGTVVAITPGFWTHHQIWWLQINIRKARASDGLMGAIAPGNWLPALSNGNHLGPRPEDLGLRYQQLYETFADSWRVSDATSLFDYDGTLSTASFTNQNWPVFAPNNCVAPPISGGSQNLTPPVVIDAAMAGQLCAEIDAPDRRENCTADVMATGDADFAQTYIKSAALERNPGPPEPELSFPSDFQEDLMLPVDFKWAKSPADIDDNIRYQFCLWNSGELFNFNKCTSVSEPILTEESKNYFIIAFFLILLLLLILYLTILRNKPKWLLLIALLLLVPALFIAIQMGRSTVLNQTIASLDPTGRYFWRIVAEDDQGAITLSETRQFRVK